jgi:Transposase DDE domain
LRCFLSAGGVAKRADISEEQLYNWKLLDRFRKEVLPLLAARPLTPTETDERRTLFAEDYFCAFLFAMLNPVVTSLRALCHASHCRKMRQVCSAPISPAVFSEAQHLFTPVVLDQVVRRLAKQALGQGSGGDPRTRQALAALTAVDGTLLRAVPRMAWTPAPGPTHAVRLHLHFSVFDQVPEAWTITPGTTSERKVFNQTVAPGALVVADRHFSNHHALLEQLRSRGVHFVFRLNNNTCLETVGPERALTAQDRQAGVVWDRQVRLGVRGQGPVFRVVRLEANGDVFELITTREDLSAELIGLIYRQRWQIELFFKWIKTILNCRHWLAESPAGVTIQIYCVLIAALLLMLWTGRRPNKRAVESLRLYWLGWATKQELVRLLQRAQPPKKS